MTEQPIALKSTLKGLWRHRLLIGVLAFVGLTGGIVYAMRNPADPRAATLVLLPPSAVNSTGVPVRDMKTQVVVATSNPVLAAASHAVRPPVNVTGLKRDVTVQAVSDQVLQIEVAAPRAQEAVALANAVAGSYINFVNHVVPSAKEGGPGQILQPATNALPASKLHTPLIGAAGSGVGALLGLLVAVALSNRDRRLRTRDEISRAIGVPVLASLDAPPCRTVGQWQKLLSEYVPSPALAWNLRRLLHRLAPVGAESIQEVRTIAFSEDRAALVAGAELARTAVTLGLRTALIPADESALAPLRAACAVQGERSAGIEQLMLRLAPGEPAEDNRKGGPGPEGDRPDLTVYVLAVDRSSPQVPPFDGANIFAVSAGFATSDELARLALAAAEATQVIDGLLVVNPEPKDATAGITSDGDRQQPVARVNRSPGTEHATRRVR